MSTPNRVRVSTHITKSSLLPLALAGLIAVALPLMAPGTQVSEQHAGELVDKALEHLDCRDLHKAYAAIEAAILQAESTGDSAARAQAGFASALIASADNDWLAAHDSYESSYTASRGRGDFLAATLAGVGWARALRKLGHPRMATLQLTALRSSLDAARRAGAWITGDGLTFLARTQGVDAAFLEDARPYLSAVQPLIYGIAEHFLLREQAQAQRSLGELEEAIASLEAAGKAFPIGLADKEIIPEIATIRIEAGQLRAADQEIEQALTEARATRDRAFEIALLEARVALEEARGQPGAAIPALERQTLLAREIDDPVLEARLLNDLGWLHAEVSHFEAARRIYERAHTLCQRHNLPTLEVTVLSNLAGVLRAQGRSRDAHNLLDRAAILAKANADPHQTTLIQIGVGSALRIAGNYPDAQRALESALGSARAIRDRHLEASALHALGNVYTSRQAFEDALAVQQEALELAEVLGSKEASAHLSLAITLSSLGLFQEAEAHLSEAEALARQRGDASLLRQARDLRAFLTSQASPDAARDRFQANLEAARRAGDSPAEAQARLALGWSELNAGRPNRARRSIRRMIVRAEALELVDAQAFGHLVLSLARLKQNRLASARREIEAASALFDRIDSPMGTLAAHAVSVPFHERAGNRSSTVEAIESATDVIRTIEGQLGASASLTAFAGITQPVLTLRVLLAADGDPATAFRYADEAKARAFARRLLAPGPSGHGDVREALLARERAALARIAVLEAQVRAARDVATATTGPWHEAGSYTARTMERLDQARRGFRAIRRETEAMHLVDRTFEPGRSLDVNEVQKILDDKSTLIAYFIAGRRLLIWVVDRDTLHTASIELPSEGLGPLIHRTNAEIRSRESASKPLAALRELLIDPIQHAIRHRHVIVVPHGPLHFVPFAALDPSGTEPSASQSLTFSYLPTASMLRVVRTPGNSSPERDHSRGWVFGDADGTLPHAAAEAARVARLLATTPLLGAAAAEAEVHEHAGTISILHIAAHGVHDARNPLFSHLALAPGRGHDGRLEVREILDFDLTASQLVVLSACETARGEQTAGDDIVGLARSFLEAGAPAVITSLWPVDDEATAALMEHFYLHLLESRSGSVAGALDQAQRDVRAEPRWRAPYYWAAFVVTGEARIDTTRMRIPGG